MAFYVKKKRNITHLSFIFRCCWRILTFLINPLRLCVSYMRQWMRSSLAQIMACHLLCLPQNWGISSRPQRVDRGRLSPWSHIHSKGERNVILSTWNGLPFAVKEIAKCLKQIFEYCSQSCFKDYLSSLLSIVRCIAILCHSHQTLLAVMVIILHAQL